MATATLPNGTTVDRVIAEGWTEELRILSTFSLSAEPTEGAAPLSPTLSGSAERLDGGPVGSVDLRLTTPEGSTTTSAVAVEPDGSYSATPSLSEAGEWTVQTASSLSALQHTEEWEPPTPGPFSLEHSEGWES